jgi:hypothetical protein
VEASFIELHGKQGFDLLSQRKVVRIRCDENDRVHIRDCEYVVSDGTRTSTLDLLHRLHAALELRSCEVTERNPISSRSHAICVIRLLDAATGGNHNPSTNSSTVDLTHETALGVGGRIMLVDLAGSERNYDTTQMTRVQHRESAAINSSLMALKTCFRAYEMQVQQQLGHDKLGVKTTSAPATHHADNENAAPTNSNVNHSDVIHAPYRASLLTRILKECFTCNDTHRTLIIATVSPSSVDLMHSVNTIQHVLNMSSRLSELMCVDIVEVVMKGLAPRHLPLSEWTSEHLRNWLAYIENGRFAQVVIPHGVTAAQLSGLTSAGLSSLFEGQLRAARRDEEGVAWVEVAGASRRTNALGSLLWRSLRREERIIARFNQQQVNYNNNEAPEAEGDAAEQIDDNDFGENGEM